MYTDEEFFMSGISFHCCVSLGRKGIFCPVHFGKSLKWGFQLWSVFPYVFGFFRIPGKKSKGGSSPFMYLQSQSFVDGQFVLQDLSWLEERGLLYVWVCVHGNFARKSVVWVVGNFTQMGTKGHRMVLLAMAFSAATTITPPLLRRVFGSPQMQTWFILVKGAWLLDGPKNIFLIFPFCKTVSGATLFKKCYKKISIMDHSFTFYVLHGELRQKWDLVIIFDWWSIDTKSMRLNCILHDLFRDTPLDHIWCAQIRTQIWPKSAKYV